MFMSPSAGPPQQQVAMFHTFQAATAIPQQEQLQSAPKPTAKRISTPHACVECKRRKIRCDGRQPCGQCLGCRSPKPCFYDQHRQRVIPSRKTLDALSQSLEESRTILQRLYPTREAESLLPLTRQQLISLLDCPGSEATRTDASSLVSNDLPHSEEELQPATPNDHRGLANLEQIPSQHTDWDEDRRNRDPIPAEADDVNALSLSVDRQSSYLGATSIKAAFLVMLQCDPSLTSFIAPTNGVVQSLSAGSNYHATRSGSSVKILEPVAWSSEGQTLIDAYFNRVQIIVPMLDEPSFRADFLSGERSDAPWLALLNMVFAMGTIVSNKSDNQSHVTYYSRAKEHLPIDTFGSGHLETLQALALMGGHYLHYMNRPNMANAIIGAALRMACAMGLHREGSPADRNSANQLSFEQRRRTWWSLFCFDTWASMTLGRPSMGRWSPAITIQPPQGAPDPDAISRYVGITPLIENIKFCKIATQIQDLLAQSPVIHTKDRTNLDAQLVGWYDNLPWVLRSTEPCPESVYTARCIMKWQYQNLRIVLHRPVLLHLANRGAQGAHATSEDLTTVKTCRTIAKQTIEDIAREWTPNQMLGWHGVWFLYQASMIPLVSMFWESWNMQLVRECQQQVRIVIEAMEGLSDWSLAARPSREVLSKMYDASKRPPSCQSSPKSATHHTPIGNVINRHLQHVEGQDMRRDEMIHDNSIVLVDQHNIWDLDGMLWSSVPNGFEWPFDGMSHMEHHEQSYDENGFMMHE